MILGICNSPQVAEVLNIVIRIIDIIKIVVPIILLFSLMFKFISASTKNDQNALATLKKKAVPNIISAVLIFVIPSLIGLIVEVSFPESDYSVCLKDMTTEEIQQLYETKAEQLVSKAEETLNMSDYTNAMNYIENIKNDSKRELFEIRLRIVKQKIDERIASQLAEMQTYEGNPEIVELAKSYIKKNCGTDCSGFVKNKVLKPLGYLEDGVGGTSGYCDGKSRGSYGMYLKYKSMDRVVWTRPGGATTPSNSITNFPEDCAPGDLIFYSYGANDCVKHVAIYAGYENGAHMIIDSNQQDHIVRYRAIDKVYTTAMPLACTRPMKVGE